MNKKQTAIIIGIVLIISVLGVLAFNHYMTVRNFELENTPDQLRGIFGNCNCQADPERTCTQTFIDWQNSTHYIDNNLCEYITLEEYQQSLDL